MINFLSRAEGPLATLERCESNRLSPREIEIAMLVRQGMRNREIAQLLSISEQVVKNQLRKVFDKVGVWSRVELAMHVVEHPERWKANES